MKSLPRNIHTSWQLLCLTVKCGILSQNNSGPIDLPGNGGGPSDCALNFQPTHCTVNQIVRSSYWEKGADWALCQRLIGTALQVGGGREGREGRKGRGGKRIRYSWSWGTVQSHLWVPGLRSFGTCKPVRVVLNWSKVLGICAVEKKDIGCFLPLPS
jgi:hypothetical protein